MTAVPLAEQIVEVEKEVRGRLLRDTADRKLAAMRAVQSTLMWLEQNLVWVRPEAERRLKAQRLAAEAETLRDDPAVAAVLETFPGAEIASVRELPLSRAAADPAAP